MQIVQTIHSSQSHADWDNALAPVLRVEPGMSVEFEVADASGGQIDRDSDADDLNRLDFSRVNPVTGPVFVEGAAPGDALEVTIESLAPSGWGWTGVIPGFGLLADDFPEPALRLWSYDAAGLEPAMFGDVAAIPLKPFPGTIGLAPAEPGPHSVVPPRRVGGNLDLRDLGAGTVLSLPVEVDGALFSVGDTHAAQGDGEVCGTAIESPMSVALTFNLATGARLPAPQFETAVPVSRHLDERGYFVTTGVANDLMSATRDAVRAMIDKLGAWRGLDPPDAYMLCSVCADLRISEVVDAPNWVVSFYFPKVVFDHA
ncbi:MAG: acetamidase/formamidase family protein [Actinomycetota bacterium]